MAGRSTVYAPSGMVATSQPLASAAGLEVLRQGGNAIDAAVAAAAVLSVTEPHMTGHRRRHVRHRLARQGAEARRAQRERARRLAHDARSARRRAASGPGSQQGVLSVTVPGALAGWEMLVRTHGRRSLAQALQPAIGYARDGFPVTPIIAAQWADETRSARAAIAAAAAPSCPAAVRPRPASGSAIPTMRAPCRTIADRRHRRPSTAAPLGQRIVARLAALDGLRHPRRPAQERPDWVTPISVPFRGYRVWELPPNNQGIAALEMLRILEPYDLKAMGHNSAAYLHHLIEAKKLAYADLERFVGDADHLDMPRGADAVAIAFIAERRSHLDATRAQARVDPGPAPHRRARRSTSRPPTPRETWSR